MKQVESQDHNQAMTDLQILSEKTVQNSDILILDKLQVVKTLLLNRIKDILQVYDLSSTLVLDIHSIDKVRSKLAENSNEFVVEIFDSYISPAITMANSSDLPSLGKAWLLASIGIMALYVPNIPFDPAIRQHVEFDRAQNLMEQYKDMSESWDCIKSIFIGCSNTDLDNLWNERLPKLQDIVSPSVFRPSVSQIGSIHDEWIGIISSSIGDEIVKPLVDSISLSPPQLAQIKIIQRNTTQFIDRSSNNHYRYSDITSIFHGIIYGIKFGLDLLVLQPVSEGLSPFFLTNPTYLSQTHKLYQAFLAYKDTIKSMPTKLSEKVILALLGSVDLITKTEGKTSSELDEITSFAYQTFYYKWSLNRIRAENEAASKTTIFKDTTEEDADKDFMRMFPDYEEVVAIEDDGIKKDEDYTQLMDLYLRTFSESAPYSLQDVSSVGCDSLQEFSEYYPEKFITQEVSSVFPSIITSLNQTLTGQSLGNDEVFDFYHQPKPEETIRVTKLVNRVKTQISKYMESWPEHATLQNITVACDDILSYPVSTPVARYLQKVENLYAYLDEWEKFTSRDYTVKPVFNEMTELIVSWRRLELSTWPKLFEVQEIALKKELGKWWFYLFENLIENPSKSDSEKDETSQATLVQTLTLFITQASYGEFSHRLRLLRAFAKHTLTLQSVIPRMKEVSECISNVANYYSQYSTQIANHIANGKKSLQKEINDVILLASWKDTNIDALRESAKRSHAKLYRILKKYRTLIGENVDSIVKSGMEPITTAVTSNIVSLSPTPTHKPVEKYITQLNTLEIWKSRPARLTNVEGTAKLLHNHLLIIKDETLPSIEIFATDLVSEMERLKKETPAVLTEENKSLVSNLKNEKTKLLTDTLKELRRGGLKANVRADIKAKLLLITGIMSSVPSLIGKSVGPGDKYFYRILDILPRLRVSVTESESDAPIADLMRGIAMSENLISSLITHRENLDTLVTNNRMVKTLLDTINSLTGLLDSSDRVEVLDDYSYVNHIRSTIAWVPKLMRFAIESCHQASSLGKLRYSGETIIFSQTESRFKDLEVRFDHFKFLTDINVMSKSLNEILLSTREELELLISGLKKWQLKYPLLSFVSDSVTLWSEDRLLEIIQHPHLTPASNHSLEELDSVLQNISDSILVLFQKSREIMSESISQESDNWLILSQARLVNFCKVLRQTQFSTKLGKAISITKSLAAVEDTTTQQNALALLGSAIPFINEYYDLCNIVETRMIQNYSSSNKGGFILFSSLQNLAQNGFCSPQEEQSNEEDSGATKDGTGLGDGSGAQNNSNDVEDDEDLSEHAQKDNEEQNNEEKNEDEDDNAVDIEGEMGAGNLEDASDQEKSDEEDQSDDDENELDEEVGDVDELDPNTVDEKMWDEQGDDKDREKKSDDIPEGANEDDMEAKEDEKETDEGKDPKQSEDGKKEEDNEAEEEDDVAEQDDNVKQEDKDDLEPQVPESETLELPEDMNLDGEDDEKEDKGENEDDKDDDVDMPDVEEDFEGGEDDNSAKDNLKEQEGMDAESEAEEDGDDEDENQEIDPDAMEVDPEPQDNEGEGEGENEENENPEDEPAPTNPEEGDDVETKPETENDMKFETEGLHGPDQAEDDLAEPDDNAITQDQSTNQGEGSEQAAEQEQDNMETSGGQSSAKPEEDQEKKEDPEASEDQARKDVENSMKTLGDALKEFHKRKQEIKEASEKDESADQGANERPDEFEHMDNANSSTQDTQALGAASQDQVQKIDDSKAIEDEQEQQQFDEPEVKEVEEADVMDTDENQQPAGQESSDMPQTAGSMVGERKKEEVLGETIAGEAMDIDEDEAEEAESEADLDVAEPGFEQARSLEESRELWRNNESITQESAMTLCEQLRLILEPTQATKLRGDFKTGKRLNMKRIIPYIASQFKKDKIWMRRTKPSKRQYQVMIAVDDSKSMSESQSVKLAFQSIALISKALTQLEAGQLSIARFGETTQLVHPFEKPFSSESGAHALQWFGFNQERTDVKALVEKSISLFEEAEVNSAASNAGDLWRLEIIISDGICEDHDTLRRLVRRAREERIMMVFVIVDGLNNQRSILDLDEVRFDTDEAGNSTLKLDKYLDHFPFDFYVIVKDVRELPNVLSLVLRQFFAEVAENSG